jgi:hypothetical protein
LIHLKEIVMKTFHTLSRFSLAIVFAALLTSGCGKFKPVPKGPTAEQKSATENRIREKLKERADKVAEVKAAAKTRRAELKDEAEPFDEKTAARDLMLDKYKLDVDELKPLTPKEVEAEVARRAELEADQKFPPAMADRFREQLKQEYPLYKVGDIIAVTNKIGRTTRGKISMLENGQIKIGQTIMPVVDIVEPHPSGFDPGKNEKWRAFMLRKSYKVPRDDLVAGTIKKLREPVYRELGFVKKNGNRVRYDELLKTEIAPEVEKLKAAYEAKQDEEIKKQVETEFTEKGLLPLPPQVPIDAGYEYLLDEVAASEFDETAEGGDFDDTAAEGEDWDDEQQ